MNWEEYLVKNNDEMVSALQRIIRLKSEAGERVETKDGQVYPFGEDVQRCYEEFMKMAEDMGFETTNVDNYGGHIDFVGTGEDRNPPKVFAIIGHLDVVPCGSGWDLEPYGGEIKDGFLYGRGTTDDKGPMISCLYAMKALKESGYKPKNTIRVIVGLDEETNWYGMEYYLEKVKKPDYGFTPDGDFPIINGEKGILTFEMAKKFDKSNDCGLYITKAKGGTADNSVADLAKATVKFRVKDEKSKKEEEGRTKAYDEIKDSLEKYKEESGYNISLKKNGKTVEITAVGKAAHGAKPSAGLNAISILMEFLGKIKIANEGQKEYIDMYNQYISFETDGKSIGVAMEDEPSGALTFNVGLLNLNEEIGEITVNVRYPVTKTDEEVYGNLAWIIEKYDFGMVKHKTSPPIFKDVNDPMIKDLLEIYRKHTGDNETPALVIGGGTYARATDNIVAYGALFPGDQDIMHQRNECISLKRLEQMTKIYAEAIYKLSSKDYNIL